MAATSSGTAVGVACTAGVVVGATERVATGGAVTGSVRRVEQVDERAAVAPVGSVGDCQAFARALGAEADRHRVEGRPLSARALATRAGDLAAEHGVDALLAAVTPDADETFFQLDAGGGVTADDRAAIGSGQGVALGVLEAETVDSLADARTLVRDALAAVADRSAGDAGAADLAVVTDAGVEFEHVA